MQQTSTTLYAPFFSFFCFFPIYLMIFQKYIYNRLKIPQKAERYRPRGSAKETSFEMQFEYLHYTTPRKSMSEGKREKLLNKIRRLANWLDNAIPNSPIPLGIDSLLVSDITCGILYVLRSMFHTLFHARVSFRSLVDS